ncbi:hypothetical protein WJX84_008106 [Apatococcus fuscideae]|uniref:Transcription factor CBF/NF-Y/archaeal histone domain-containing protein n=1 Tax=Apatococcus fuscideae TaxID=2026836 RepID=A0AAW1SYV1_9CHLO
MMQTSEDVGKIASATPVLIARAMEVFVDRLCKGTAAVAATKQGKTVSSSHLKAFIDQTEEFDFLRGLVNAPDEPAGAESRPSGRGRSRGSRGSQNVGEGDGVKLEAGTEAAGRGRGRGQGSKRKASAASASLDPLQEPGSVKAELDTAPGLASGGASGPTGPAAGLAAAVHSSVGAPTIPVSAFKSAALGLPPTKRQAIPASLGQAVHISSGLVQVRYLLLGYD